MKVNEGDLVYAYLNDHPTQCQVIALNFSGNIHVISDLSTKQSYIANEDELTDNPDDCLKNYMEKTKREYDVYCEMVDSPEHLILHLLHASVNGRTIKDVERKAIIDKAEEFTQINVEEYLEKLDEIERKKRKHHEYDEYS